MDFFFLLTREFDINTNQSNKSNHDLILKNEIFNSGAQFIIKGKKYKPYLGFRFKIKNRIKPQMIIIVYGIKDKIKLDIRRIYKSFLWVFYVGII